MHHLWSGTALLPSCGDNCWPAVIYPPPVADMYSLEPLKYLCMLQIPVLLTEDNAIDVLNSLPHSKGLGEHHYQLGLPRGLGEGKYKKWGP